MQTLLPLFAPPRTAAEAWEAVRRRGSGTVALVNVEDGPGSGRDPGWTAAIGRLVDAGVQVLGYVDFDLGTRPARHLRAQIRRWAGYPVDGVFLDHVPTSAYLIAVVAHAVGTARRAGLRRVVLNHGMPPDPLYRILPAQTGVFDGDWSALRDSPAGTRGDAFLVHGVPAAERSEAKALLSERGAGLALLTDAGPDDAFTTLPSWHTPARAR
jgi:Spherulation-specific family 4